MMFKIVKAVVATVALFLLVLGVIIFAGVYTKVFMSICFAMIFCCVCGVVYSELR